MSVGRKALATPVGLAELFVLHHADLVRLALLVVGDQPTAEDVFQDVFARLHARPDRPGRPGEELPYIRAGVLNGCRSVLRRRALTSRVRTVEADSNVAASAESEVLLAEDRKQVLDALARLLARRREVLVLRYWLGPSEARRTGMSAADGALSQLRGATDPTAKGGEFYGPLFVNNGPPVRKPILRKVGIDKAIAALRQVSERETGLAIDGIPGRRLAMPNHAALPWHVPPAMS